MLSTGLFLGTGAVFGPSSWAWLVLLPPSVCEPLPPMSSPILPPVSFLHRSCCCTLICSLCSSIFASLWICPSVLGPWSPLRGTQLFWGSQIDNECLMIKIYFLMQLTDPKDYMMTTLKTISTTSHKENASIFTFLRSKRSCSMKRILDEVFPSLMIFSIWWKYWSMWG